MTLTSIQLNGFSAITNFVLALSKQFGNKQHSLALYARLIEHTTLSHEPAILKHLEAFSKYVSENQMAIENTEESKLNSTPITYSDKLYIDLSAIFKVAEPDIKKVIWQHLITILGILFPDSQAKEIMRKLKSQKKSSETELVGEMIQKIVPHLDAEETNPMQAVLGILQSGVFSDLVATMQKGMDDGTVNVQSLLGTMTTMFSQQDPAKKLSLIEDTSKPPSKSD